MATRTSNRTNRTAKSTAAKGSGGGNDSAFSWGAGGALIGAAVGGAALAIAANLGRKLIVQGMAAKAGDWDQALAAEHDMTLAIFDKMLATDSSQTIKRTLLFKKLGHALDKHAHEEEHVVYPALRQANEAHDAELLEHEHGEVKSFLYRLDQMGSDSPEWLETVRQLRDSVATHARMEEEQVFPRLKQGLTEAQNARITSMVNKDGFAMA